MLGSQHEHLVPTVDACSNGMRAAGAGCLHGTFVCLGNAEDVCPPIL